MKRLLLLFALALMLGSDARAHGGISLGFFYSSLEPHGEWIAVEGGYYAWRPFGVVHDWRPYTVGRWLWTPDGWYWYSPEPWGWATYHYGRWFYDDYYGWLWIPGYEWAPAWVEWRYGGPYVAWAPLGPYAVFDIHLGITYHHAWTTPVIWWNFVDCRYMDSPSLHRHLYKPKHNHRYFGATRGVGRIGSDEGRPVLRGPAREDVERRGRIRVRTADIMDGEDRGEKLVRRGERERIQVYRPPVERQMNDIRERPGRVRDEVRRVPVTPEHLSRGSDDAVRPAERGRRVPDQPERIRREESVPRPERGIAPRTPSPEPKREASVGREESRRRSEEVDRPRGNSSKRGKDEVRRPEQRPEVKSPARPEQRKEVKRPDTGTRSRPPAETKRPPTEEKSRSRDGDRRK